MTFALNLKPCFHGHGGEGAIEEQKGCWEKEESSKRKTFCAISFVNNLDGLFVEKGIFSICVLIGKARVMCVSFV